MSSPLTFTILMVMIGAVGVVIWSEHRGRPRVAWICKPLASTGFVIIAMLGGALDSSYGAWVLIALVFCWFGDVLLIPRSRAAFLAGLASFLVGHAVFAIAFTRLGIEPTSVAMTLIIALALAAATLRWLWPHLPARMHYPVVAYLLTIAVMVALAAGTARPLLVVAATTFAISDLLVARQRFIVRTTINRLIGLPLYYGAQVLFALSAGAR